MKFKFFLRLFVFLFFIQQSIVYPLPQRNKVWGAIGLASIVGFLLYWQYGSFNKWFASKKDKSRTEQSSYTVAQPPVIVEVPTTKTQTKHTDETSERSKKRKKKTQHATTITVHSSASSILNTNVSTDEMSQIQNIQQKGKYSCITAFILAQQFPANSDVRTIIEKAPTAREAKSEAEAHKGQIREDWDSLNIAVTLHAVFYAFFNNKQLKEWLIGDVEMERLTIYFVFEGDDFFGILKKGGNNYLGAIVTWVRQYLRGKTHFGKTTPSLPLKNFPAKDFLNDFNFFKNDRFPYEFYDNRAAFEPARLIGENTEVMKDIKRYGDAQNPIYVVLFDENSFLHYDYRCEVEIESFGPTAGN